MLVKLVKSQLNRVNCVIRVACAIIAGSLFVIGANATDSVPSESVLEPVYAGAAEVIEVNTIPTVEEVEQIIADNAWKNPGSLVMANCNNSVNVRTEASEESEKAGKIYSDCGGYIVEYTDDWTLVQTGELTGWIYNDYLLFGDDAKNKADEVGSNRATINEESVRVRAAASTEAEILDLVAKGDAFEVVGYDGNWLIVDYEGTSGYINADLADVEFIIDSGETMAAIEAREAAEKEAQAKALAAKKEAERKQYYGVFAAEATDVELLGALIQCESGNQPYEGQQAVGAVVMNRVRSGAYPSTIYGVIYASGQFTPARTGAVDRRLEKGVSQQCLQAAQDAINGYSPVGTAMHFRPVGAREGIVIGGHVFW